jgi:hypothetical protein
MPDSQRVIDGVRLWQRAGGTIALAAGSPERCRDDREE